MIDHEEIMMPRPQTQLSRARAGAYVLKVSGRLSTGWAGWLAQSLAHEGFNIERVSARRDARGQWTAQIDFTRLSLGADPEMLDFDVIVTQRPPAGAAAMLRVWDCEVIASDDGSVALSVVGPDQHGFLAAILEGLAFLSLFPIEMSIETDRGVARDRFVLRSTGGGNTSVEALNALREWLQSLIVAGTIRSQKSVPPADRGSDEVLP